MSHAHPATLEGDGFRIVLDEGGPNFGYWIEIPRDDSWVRVTDTNPLIAGDSFRLAPQSITHDGAAIRCTGSGSTPSGGPYSWESTISKDVNSWIRFDIEIDSQGFDIGATGVEPQIVVNTGALPPYERGDHVWFKVNIDNPTVWNDEARGNDFPATYYYDPYSHAEFRMFFDMTAMSWMGPDNLARFHDLRCGLRRRLRGRPQIEFGLIGETQSGHRWPSGRQRVVYYLHAGYRDHYPTPPTEREEIVALVDACLPLIPSPAGFPARATTWEDLAVRAAIQLMDDNLSWGRDDQGEHMLNYVDGRSDAWVNAMSARGMTFDGRGPCLESALWVLHPLEILARTRPDLDFGDLRERCERFIRREVMSPRALLTTGVHSDPTPIGTWQYAYRLAESWYLYRIAGDDTILVPLLRDIDTVLIPLYERCGGIFPLQFDKSTLDKLGPGDGHAISGLFALLMLDVAKYTGDDSYAQRAKDSLVTLYNLPINVITQESFLLGQAADAAHRIASEGGVEHERWMEIARYFVAQSLRMMYWYNDRTDPRVSSVDHLGMFLACGAINYPAFLENVEMDARLSALTDVVADRGQLLKVLDLGRRANFHFFPAVNPDLHGLMPLDAIPFEEVPILEGTPVEDGFVGQEIYGAGWVFRALLLWEGSLRSSNREIMILATTSYRESEFIDAPRLPLRVLIANSTKERQATTLTLPTHLKGKLLGVSARSGAGDLDVTEALSTGTEVVLEPGAVIDLVLTVEGRDLVSG